MNNKGWTIEVRNTTTHIIPLKDVISHEEASTCYCRPKLEELPNGNLMFTHNSYDGREYIERLTDTDNLSLN